MAIVWCPECGLKTPRDSKFCVHCGYDLEEQCRREKLRHVFRALRLLVFMLFAVVVFLIGWGLFSQNRSATVDEYLAKGDYQNAYKLVKDNDTRSQLLVESNVAMICQDIVDSMENPKSFELSEAVYVKYYYKQNADFYYDFYYDIYVLIFYGRDAIGRKVVGGYYIGENDGSYVLAGEDTTLEDTYTILWEDLDDSDKELFGTYEGNVLRKLKEEVEDYFALYGLEESFECEWNFLSQEGIARINMLFSEGNLSSVKSIPVVKLPWTDSYVGTSGPEDTTPLPEPILG